MHLAIISLSCIALTACDRAAQLSDDLDIRFGEHVPLDIAECAGMYRAFELEGAAYIATVATYEAAQLKYGWAEEEAEEEIEKDRHNFTPFGKYERVGERCSQLMPLMSRLYERRNAERN